MKPSTGVHGAVPRGRAPIACSAVAALLTAAGCGLHDFNNDTGGALNLAMSGGYVVAARGSAGVEVVRAGTSEVVSHVDPGGEADSYDDVTAEGARVLLHDADDGWVQSFTLAADGTLTAASSEVEVDAGPYSGVSLAGGAAMISGGTCRMTFLAVDAAGGLAVSGSLEANRGQPDVTMLPGLDAALSSTHFSGSEDEFIDGQEFGVSTVSVVDRRVVDRAGLVGAGFSGGGGRPASWPVRAVAQGDLVYVAHGGGLDILRIEADLQLTPLSHLTLSVAATDVAVDGGSAFVVGVPATVVVVDVGDPTAPRLDRELPIDAAGANPTAVAVAEGRIYVAANGAGLVTLPR